MVAFPHPYTRSRGKGRGKNGGNIKDKGDEAQSGWILGTELGEGSLSPAETILLLTPHLPFSSLGFFLSQGREAAPG